MSTAKVAALCIAGVLALAGIIAAIVLRYRGASRASPDTVGNRLLAHSRDRSDYRLFVGVPIKRPSDWAEVARIDGSSVRLASSQILELSEVTAYLVAYPSGTLVDKCGPNSLPLPEWVKFLEPSVAPERDKLTEADLQAGLSRVKVEFGKRRPTPDSQDHYSTTLTNLSGERVRVPKFGAHTRVGKAFVLHTVSRRFFTPEDFKEWCGQAGEWIEPGQAVTDPNNYGTPPMLWAYYCESEGGKRFVTGGIIR